MFSDPDLDDIASEISVISARCEEYLSQGLSFHAKIDCDAKLLVDRIELLRRKAHEELEELIQSQILKLKLHITELELQFDESTPRLNYNVFQELKEAVGWITPIFLDTDNISSEAMELWKLVDLGKLMKEAQPRHNYVHRCAYQSMTIVPSKHAKVIPLHYKNSKTDTIWWLKFYEKTAVNVNWTNSDGEIVFHFNPRSNENQIVMNSWKLSTWGREERIQLPSDVETGPVWNVFVSLSSAGFNVAW